MLAVITCYGWFLQAGKMISEAKIIKFDDSMLVTFLCYKYLRMVLRKMCFPKTDLPITITEKRKRTSSIVKVSYTNANINFRNTRNFLIETFMR